MNICGCLAHVLPERGKEISGIFDAIEGVETHAVTEDGRVVVVVEDTESRLASETIMQLHQIPGVISLALTYHYFEDEAAREHS